jgi:hypothetical protein
MNYNCRKGPINKSRLPGAGVPGQVGTTATVSAQKIVLIKTSAAALA